MNGWRQVSDPQTTGRRGMAAISRAAEREAAELAECTFAPNLRKKSLRSEAGRKQGVHRGEQEQVERMRRGEHLPFPAVTSPLRCDGERAHEARRIDLEPMLCAAQRAKEAIQQALNVRGGGATSRERPASAKPKSTVPQPFRFVLDPKSKRRPVMYLDVALLGGRK